MSYSICLSTQLGYSHYTGCCNGNDIFLTEWMSCEVVWLTWLQLPYRAVVFNVLASKGTLLVVPASFPSLPALSASRILSILINHLVGFIIIDRFQS
jgi:hypothetical protein